jgi:hypothetical protein
MARLEMVMVVVAKPIDLCSYRKSARLRAMGQEADADLPTIHLAVARICDNRQRALKLADCSTSAWFQTSDHPSSETQCY